MFGKLRPITAKDLATLNYAYDDSRPNAAADWDRELSPYLPATSFKETYAKPDVAFEEEHFNHGEDDDIVELNKEEGGENQQPEEEFDALSEEPSQDQFEELSEEKTFDDEKWEDQWQKEMDNYVFDDYETPRAVRGKKISNRLSQQLSSNTNTFSTHFWTS